VLWHCFHKLCRRTPPGFRRTASISKTSFRSFARTFFRTASVGPVPRRFGRDVCFAAERLRYELRRIETLEQPAAELDGMQIVQISDIHLSTYMTRESVRRAVDMANDVGARPGRGHRRPDHRRARLHVDCVEEVRQLRARSASMAATATTKFMPARKTWPSAFTGRPA